MEGGAAGVVSGGAQLREQVLEMMGCAMGEHHGGEAKCQTDEQKAWRLVLEELEKRGWTEQDLKKRRKTDALKVKMAARLRSETVMTLDWIARRLQMGCRHTVANCLKAYFYNSRDRPLGRLLAEGVLFPYLSRVRAGDRATEFKSRCRQLGINGVSLHSYRYAWAERAKTVGYPERFAREALGHNSKAVHRAYAKRALMKIPSLEDYEQRAEKQAELKRAAH